MRLRDSAASWSQKAHSRHRFSGGITFLPPEKGDPTARHHVKAFSRARHWSERCWVSLGEGGQQLNKRGSGLKRRGLELSTSGGPRLSLSRSPTTTGSGRNWASSDRGRSGRTCGGVTVKAVRPVTAGVNGAALRGGGEHTPPAVGLTMPLAPQHLVVGGRRGLCVEAARSRDRPWWG